MPNGHNERTILRASRKYLRSEYIRNKIRVAAEEYQAMDERMRARFTGIENGTSASSPSAPSSELDDLAPTAPALKDDDEETPSAPPIETFQSTECVVCMENIATVVFGDVTHHQ